MRAHHVFPRRSGDYAKDGVFRSANGKQAAKRMMGKKTEEWRGNVLDRRLVIVNLVAICQQSKTQDKDNEGQKTCQHGVVCREDE